MCSPLIKSPLQFYQFIIRQASNMNMDRKMKAFNMDREAKVSQQVTGCLAQDNENNQNVCNGVHVLIRDSKAMQPSSIEYLTGRIRDLEEQNQRQEERIQALKSQNEQLMGVVVQASHHDVNRTKQFVKRVEELIFASGASRSRERQGLKTEGSRRSLGSKSKCREWSKVAPSGVYNKMKKSELQREMEGVRRIEKRVL